MWWPVLPQILLAIILLLLPGLLIALALRFTSFDALALAPALSVGVIVIASTAAPYAGLTFGVPPVAAATAALTSVAFLAGRRSRPTDSTADTPARLQRMAPFAGFALAALLIGWRSLQVIGTPNAFSQTYDAIFHLNSVRYALDTGQASSLTIGGMTGGGFYPAGWNALTTFVATATGAGVAQSVNITSIVVASIFWPLSCVLMATWIVGRSTVPAIVSGVSCASMGAFPLLMMDFGVLYPNLLAISILPGCIALAARLLGAGDVRPQVTLPVNLALLLGLAGLMVSHPTTFMAWLVWTLPMVAYATYRSTPKAKAALRTGGRAFIGWVLGPALYSLGFTALWIFLRPPEAASFWGPYQTVPQALGEALLVSPMGLAPAWLVAPLVLLGLWASYRSPHRFGWTGVVFIIFTGLFVLVSGFPKSPLRNFLAGVWYNDSYRIAALLPVAGVLLAAVGVAWIAPRIRGPVGALPTTLLFPGKAVIAPRRRFLQRAGGVLLVLAAVALGQQGGLKQEAAQAATRYTIDEDSPLVSDDELAVIQRLRQTVPAGSTVLGNPYTGAALAYALGDRKAAQLHVLSYISPELQKIHENLGDVASDPAVCDAIRKENAYYVLDFGTREVHGGDHTPAGFLHLDSNPGLQLVDSEGDAKVYRITGCA